MGAWRASCRVGLTLSRLVVAIGARPRCSHSRLEHRRRLPGVGRDTPAFGPGSLRGTVDTGLATCGVRQRRPHCGRISLPQYRLLRVKRNYLTAVLVLLALGAIGLW